MSYKAFTRLKKHTELEFLKTLSLEQINEILCDFKEKLDAKEKRITELESQLKNMPRHVDVRVNDLLGIARTAKSLGLNPRREHFNFALSPTNQSLSPSNQMSQNKIYFQVVVDVTKDYDFGWMARFELKGK